MDIIVKPGQRTKAGKSGLLLLCFSLFGLVACGNETNNVSDYISDKSSRNENGQSSSRQSTFEYSDHTDGESIVYSFSCFSFIEFSAFFNDFSISNSASFITFDFDNDDDITSEFVFEGYPAPVDIDRKKIATTSFQYFHFSFSFSNINRDHTGEDNSCIISANDALLIDLDTIDSSNLTYSAEKQNTNTWKVDLSFDDRLISTLKISFNREPKESAVTEYCESLINRAVLLKGGNRNV